MQFYQAKSVDEFLQLAFNRDPDGIKLETKVEDSEPERFFTHFRMDKEAMPESYGAKFLVAGNDRTLFNFL